MSDKKIPITTPWIGEEEATACRRTILSGWVTQGPEVASFEREFASYIGAPYACAVSSCTAALHLALLAVGVKPGDEVITVSHSFIATANAIRYCGATPVFVDIEENTFNIDPEAIERVITNKTRAILPVHQMGLPCDVRSILKIAEKNNLRVVEDAACAIGSQICINGNWERIGKPHGDISCFSFHPRKIITTGDGGMLTTYNKEIFERLRLLRQHGMSVPDTTRHNANQVIFESYPILGYNYRMTDIQASVGREQLKKIDKIIERRRFLAKRYNDLLSSNSKIIVPHEPKWAKSNWQSYCIQMPHSCIQKDVMQYLLNYGISTRRGIMCAHREVHYKSNIAFDLSKSENAQDRCIILPLYPQLKEEEQDYIIEMLLKYFAS